VPGGGREIRPLRDYTRLRTDLTRDRTRYWSRLEKLLEDALIKVSSVASSLDTRSVRDMLEALIAGERDPAVLAGLARGKIGQSKQARIGALSRTRRGFSACASARPFALRGDRSGDALDLAFRAPRAQPRVEQ
jgi:hypothetical protein